VVDTVSVIIDSVESLNSIPIMIPSRSIHNNNEEFVPERVGPVSRGRGEKIWSGGWIDPAEMDMDGYRRACESSIRRRQSREEWRKEHRGSCSPSGIVRKAGGGSERHSFPSSDNTDRRRNERETGRIEEKSRRRSNSKSRDRRHSRGEESGSGRSGERAIYHRREDSCRSRRDERGGYGRHRSRSPRRPPEKMKERGRDRSRSPFREQAREGAGRKKAIVPPLVLPPGSDLERGKQKEGKMERMEWQSLRWREMGGVITAPLQVVLPPSTNTTSSNDRRTRSPVSGLPIVNGATTISTLYKPMVDKRGKSSSSLHGRNEENEGKRKGEVVPFNAPLLTVDAALKSRPSDPRMKRGKEEERMSASQISPKQGSLPEGATMKATSVQETIATEPIRDPRHLCFDFPYACDYQSIVSFYESLRAEVIVIRCPSIDRLGVCLLKLCDADHAQIVHDHGSEYFSFLIERFKIKPKYPGLISFSTNREVEVSEIEQEMEIKFGTVAEISMRSSKRGTVRFVNEKDAKYALSKGTYNCRFLEGVTITFEGVTLREGIMEEWKAEMDSQWPHNLIKIRAAREAQIREQDERKPWEDDSMQQLIKAQMDDNGEVTLVGGPLEFSLDIDAVKDFFRRNFKAVFVNGIDCPQSENDDPGFARIVVKVDDVTSLLSVTEHQIDEFPFFVGLPFPIEITTLAMDKSEQWILGESLQFFGAVVGFLRVSEKDERGFERYRITFMHWDTAVSVHNLLSACKGGLFLAWLPSHILIDVVLLKTW
ncbi:hypothetical protein PMAYCL1PPCAC_02050, partial [Pristionchus mayeri]